MEKVIVEVMVRPDLSDAALMDEIGGKLPGLQLDPGYPPVDVTPSDPSRLGVIPDARVVVVRGQIAPHDKSTLEAAPGVLGVWSDGPIVPFADEEPGR